MNFQSFYILLRRLVKDKLLYTIIFTNLILGYAAFFVISQFTSGQLSFDKHNTNYNRIYRLQLFMDQKENSVKHTWSVTAALSRKELAEQPEIEKIALLHDVGDNNKNGVFLSSDKKNEFLTRYGYFADSTVFDIFTFRFIEGEPKEALVNPFTIVLSKEIADKLFPGGNALGKQVFGENKVVFTVTGVYEDLPYRSTWRPVFLMPMCSFSAISGRKGYETDYMAYTFYTYVLLKPNATAAPINEEIYFALKDFRKEHHPYLRPMSMLKLNPFFEPGFYVGLLLISILSLLILLLSAINFINLQTANTSTRFREIGIKKTLGFNRKKLWLQFMFESLTLTFMAALAGLILAQLFIPTLNNIMGNDLFPDIFENRMLIVIIFAITLITGILSALHPAYVIASYNPVTALKQKFLAEKSNGISLKKILVTVQFSISIFMLIVAFIIYRQTEYMLTREMGFNSETVMFSNIVTNKKGSLEPLRQRLLEHSEIKDVCISDYIPFILPGGDDLGWEGSKPDEKVFVRFSKVSYDFVPTYGLKIQSGRNFSREYPADRNKCLINETAAKVFGWSDPLGKPVKVYNKTYEVIGVVKDYVVFSSYNPIEPHMYRFLPDSAKSDAVYSVHFAEGKEKRAMEIVKDEFEKFFPEDAFEFKNIQFLIQNEGAVTAFKSFRELTALIAILTIIISSIGLFGLILFMTQRKMKEVGIRKVLGFSSASLYITLSSDFIKLIFYSLIIAWPASYWVYTMLPGTGRYGLQVWEFLLATLIILIVAIMTISYQIIRALRVKPVEILKDE